MTSNVNHNQQEVEIVRKENSNNVHQFEGNSSTSVINVEGNTSVVHSRTQNRNIEGTEIITIERQTETRGSMT